MNRILIDELGKEDSKGFNIVLDKDCNILIDKYQEIYNIKAVNGNINILCILEDIDDIDFNFDVLDANICFNMIGYNNKNINILADLYNKNSKFEMYNSIISIDEQLVNVKINHNKENTISNVYNFATTKKDGSVVFNVIAKVIKGNKNCIINQDSKIITFNNKHNKINPILLIDEYEVNAKHSAYIGEFDDDELFYLQTRGLTKDDASRLLLNGFLIGMLCVSDEEKELLRQKIQENWR